MAQLKQLQQQLKDNDRPARYSSLYNELQIKQHLPKILARRKQLLKDDDDDDDYTVDTPLPSNTKYDGLNAYLNYHYRDILDDGELYEAYNNDLYNKQILDNKIYIHNNHDVSTARNPYIAYDDDSDCNDYTNNYTINKGDDDTYSDYIINTTTNYDDAIDLALAREVLYGNKLRNTYKKIRGGTKVDLNPTKIVKVEQSIKKQQKYYTDTDINTLNKILPDAVPKAKDEWEITPDRGSQIAKEFIELRQQLIKFTMKQSLRKKEYKHFINKLTKAEQHIIDLLWHQCNNYGKRGNLNPNRTIKFKGVKKAEWLQKGDEWLKGDYA